jgi:branched-chain amino acid transport system ATP-binding protein
MSLLDARDVRAFYGDFQALFGIDFHIEAGETVAIIGANGAGKSTFLKCLTNLVHARGAIRFDGLDIDGVPTHRLVRQGIAMVPEGRRLFPSLSVAENLQVGGDAARPGGWTLARLYALFPQLGELRGRPSHALSGGQQQMVAIGRALLANPRLLLCDEISLGLAPVVIRDIYRALPEIAAAGTSLIVVEQDIGKALEVSDRAYCFQEGRVALEGRSTELSRAAIRAAYFGI